MKTPIMIIEVPPSPLLASLLVSVIEILMGLLLKPLERKLPKQGGVLPVGTAKEHEYLGS